MTDRAEITHLQDRARRAGRTATLLFNETGQLDGVFYMDPKGGPASRAGRIMSLLSFAELERTRPQWWERN